MIAIILAHGKGQNILDLNLETIKNWCTDFEIICPEDDPVFGYKNIHLRGRSEHNGVDSVERMRYACEVASKHKQAFIVEYDTMCFSKAPKAKKGKLLACGPFYDLDGPFKSKWYSHSPWVLSQTDFKKLAKCPTAELETNFPDRWLAAACDSLAIEPSGLDGWYSRNSIDTDEYLNDAIVARKCGAIAIHGIKTSIVYEALR